MENNTVAVVGLGYVGLPLALAFGRVMTTVGFDVDQKKIKAYREGFDPTGEMEPELFQRATHLTVTNEASQIERADFVVIAVPTPVDDTKSPDFRPLISASKTVGKHLKPGQIVIYESTVYPGATEEVCLPVLEAESGLKCGPDFKIGYSPERVNPGDKEHTLEKIVKVVSGQDADTLDKVARLYELIIKAGVHRAANIRVAEAAKVIENVQRDINIALMNELALIFNHLDIDTMDVLQAAGTKWNFLPFRPGLVGGHCIGVDPYYLTHKAQAIGYHPEVILKGRRINDSMGEFVANQCVKMMIQSDRHVKDSHVLVMGLTFKENCADTRNTRVVDIIDNLKEFGVTPIVWDPVAQPHEAKEEYGIELLEDLDALPSKIDAVIAAVSHKEVLAIDLDQMLARGGKDLPFLDVKSAFPRQQLEQAGFNFWRL